MQQLQLLLVPLFFPGTLPALLPGPGSASGVGAAAAVATLILLGAAAVAHDGEGAGAVRVVAAAVVPITVGDISHQELCIIVTSLTNHFTTLEPLNPLQDMYEQDKNLLNSSF